MIRGAYAKRITLDGENILFAYNGKDTEFLIPAALRENAPLAYMIEIEQEKVRECK